MLSTGIQPSRPVTVKTAWITASAVLIPLWHGGVMSDEPQTTPPSQINQAGPSVAQRTDPVRNAMERLSERDIKEFYSRCSQEAAERRLEGGEAMMCSIGYDVLLKKHFAGNFDLLLAWSRAQQVRQRE